LLAQVGAHAAVGTPARDPAPAQRIAVGLCSSCHGARGNSQLAQIPVLAGQSSAYLGAQLKAFRDHSRADDAAPGFMWGIAASLDDAQIQAVSDYYAAQNPLRRASSDARLQERGARIFQQGLERAGVTACAGCHGREAEGVADVPRLAGQQAAYFRAQLRSFQRGERDSPTMRDIARGLDPEAIEALAAYVSAASPLTGSPALVGPLGPALGRTP
jgi:cytochrome c553